MDFGLGVRGRNRADWRQGLCKQVWSCSPLLCGTDVPSEPALGCPCNTDPNPDPTPAMHARALTPVLHIQQHFHLLSSWLPLPKATGTFQWEKGSRGGKLQKISWLACPSCSARGIRVV